MALRTSTTRSVLAALLVACAAGLVSAGASAQAKKPADEPCIPGRPCSAATPASKPGPVHRAAAGRRRAVAAIKGPVAITPGFRMLPGGGSRVFVQLSQAVVPVALKSAGTLTYVLPGVHVPVHNNKHPLVTHFFNTPVADARLLADKADVRLVITLRAAAEPTSRVVETEPGRTWVLQVDFPQGSYATPSQRDPLPPAHARGEPGRAPRDAAEGEPRSAPRSGRHRAKRGSPAVGPPTP
jgi:hypothetical protein